MRFKKIKISNIEQSYKWCNWKLKAKNFDDWVGWKLRDSQTNKFLPVSQKKPKTELKPNIINFFLAYLSVLLAVSFIFF